MLYKSSYTLKRYLRLYVYCSFNIALLRFLAIFIEAFSIPHSDYIL